MPYWLYPIGTILIRDKEAWHNSLARLFQVKPEEVPLHVQTLRQAGRTLRFISKGNIRYLLWQRMRKQNPKPPGCPDPFADAPVTTHKGTLQFQVNTSKSEKDLIKECAELDLFGYMYTAVEPPRTRKSVVGLTKMVLVGGDIDQRTDCWKVSFTIDVARLGRLTDYDPSGEDRDKLLLKCDQEQDQKYEKWKRRLQKVLKAIYEVLIEPCYLAVVGLAQVPVPIFDPFLHNICSAEPEKIISALTDALQNGWLPSENLNSGQNHVWIVLGQLAREKLQREGLRGKLEKIRKDFGIIFAKETAWYEQITDILLEKLEEHEQARESKPAGS